MTRSIKIKDKQLIYQLYLLEKNIILNSLFYVKKKSSSKKCLTHNFYISEGIGIIFLLISL